MRQEQKVVKYWTRYCSGQLLLLMMWVALMAMLCARWSTRGGWQCLFQRVSWPEAVGNEAVGVIHLAALPPPSSSLQGRTYTASGKPLCPMWSLESAEATVSFFFKLRPPSMLQADLSIQQLLYQQWHQPLPFSTPAWIQHSQSRGLLPRPIGLYKLTVPHAATELPVFLTEHLPSSDLDSLFNSLFYQGDPFELAKIALDCLIQLCILKLACRERDVVFDHRDLLGRNVLVKNPGKSSSDETVILLPPDREGNDRSYTTSHVFVMTDFSESCAEKLKHNRNSVDERTGAGTRICSTRVQDASDLRLFVVSLFERSGLEEEEEDVFRTLRHLLHGYLKPWFWLHEEDQERPVHTSTFYADLVEQWERGDQDDSLYMHFFHNAHVAREHNIRSDPFEAHNVLDFAFIAYTALHQVSR